LEQPQDIYILSIETSQKVCSVAIHNNGEEIANCTLSSEKSASSLLTPIIEQTLANCYLKPTDLAAVAVAKGPGSYTGLRIAVSTAKGLCLAIEKPLIAIDTLKAMTSQVVDYYPINYMYCPMLDARRMEVFCAVLNNNLAFLEKTNAKVLDEESFGELLNKNYVVFFGDGACKCKGLFGDNKNAIFLENKISPNAKTVGKLAYQAFLNSEFENLVTFEPFYLKDFVGTQKT
jgi:tRNA threonylcarbamoyladenosine biosynthesis protein TsaB